jgi:hypothetical protein
VIIRSGVWGAESSITTRLGGESWQTARRAFRLNRPERADRLVRQRDGRDHLDLHARRGRWESQWFWLPPLLATQRITLISTHRTDPQYGAEPPQCRIRPQRRLQLVRGPLVHLGGPRDLLDIDRATLPDRVRQRADLLSLAPWLAGPLLAPRGRTPPHVPGAHDQLSALPDQTSVRPKRHRADWVSTLLTATEPMVGREAASAIA